MLKKHHLLWAFVCLWMIWIIQFSSDPADVSNQKSGRVLEKIEPVIEQVEERLHTKPLSKGQLHFFVRKNAHAFNYFVLTVGLLLALRATGFRKSNSYWLAWMIVTVFSMGDEFYQTFIPGRSGELRDVFVDNIGILAAIVVIRLKTIKKTIKD